VSAVTRRHGGGQAALALGALGVVFGDIGTSPLYTVQTLFNPGDPHPVKVSSDSVFGVISMIFWSGMIIVTITYVLLVMRADNDGEGGIMALITLVTKLGGGSTRRVKLLLAMLGVFGASLFFGDSMITPAISVLSAMEGTEVVAPSISDLVVPLTAAVLVVLFVLQRAGSATVGRLFGPVMVVWFVTIGLSGIHGIAGHPAILRALSPTYALGFFFGHFEMAFFSLAAVVLCVTGAEALYADMGHFGRKPITLMWLALVYPACTLCYLGQGALVLGDPAKAIANPFFLLVPSWGRIPMIILATAATVIASQSVISGAFSVTRQAAQLGYLPRLRIAHTSEEQIGQVYVPWINWALLVAVLGLVFLFKHSAALAYAYGMAVTCTIAITTFVFFYIARQKWRWRLWVVLAGGGLLVAVDLLFVAVNLTKFTHGAWLPLLVGLLVFTVLVTWQRGREVVTRLRQQDEGPLPAFVEQLHSVKPPLTRVPGTAIFLNRGKETAPLAMRANVEHNHVLHEHVIILSIDTVPVPHVAGADRITDIDDLGYSDDGIVHVTARFGYMDTPDIPALLPLISHAEIQGRLAEGPVSYFLSKIDLHQGKTRGLSRWRKRLFLATSRLTADAAEYFQLPRDRTVIMGARIDI
jgi:KUP system potassium uptake protein